MRERLRCPACPTSPVLADLGAALGVSGLHRCAECRGVLAGHRAVAQAREHVTTSHPVLRVRHAQHRCRRCQQRAAISATRCERCAASLALSCPGCSAPMAALEVLGIVVDVCRACELTYFDAGEFAHACHSPTAFERTVCRPVPSARASAVDALDVLVYAPDTLEVIAYGGKAAGHVAVEVASHVAHAATAVDVVAVTKTAGTAAVSAAEAAAETAGGAGESVLEVLAALFDGI